MTPQAQADNPNPLRKWISNGNDVWHVGNRKELRGAVTGKLMRTYYVTLCNGRQLGGPFGYLQRDMLPENAELCPRCAKITNGVL